MYLIGCLSLRGCGASEAISPNDGGIASSLAMRVPRNDGKTLLTEPSAVRFKKNARGRAFEHIWINYRSNLAKRERDCFVTLTTFRLLAMTESFGLVICDINPFLNEKGRPSGSPLQLSCYSRLPPRSGAPHRRSHQPGLFLSVRRPAPTHTR